MDNKDLAPYLFHQGTNFWAYEYMGCNLKVENGKNIYVFRTWAPNALRVELVSDFSGWDCGVPLEKKSKNGVWEIEYISEFSLQNRAYKFRITGKDGKTYDKGDPYARFSRGGADGASIIFENRDFPWEDESWLKSRSSAVCTKKGHFLAEPLNIYEVHFGSFARKKDGGYYSYTEMAEILIPYVKFMGFTHVEFLPLAEFPYDGSWGYQVCAFYAPTSRFGTPNDFCKMINEFHKNGIGVILDWVPAHFPKDRWGLFEFDGEPLYEYQGQDRKESRSWGTRFFDLAREEVQSFLISNALYFFREFHIDGLRVDAVASMLYLDYDKEPGAWIPNSYGNNRNLEAIAFLQKLNTAVFAEFPDALMIAEESGSYGAVTHPVSEGGLGFNLKWNMGFANDFYDYLMTDPLFRQYKHTALNFPLMYAFAENYILPVSHDEVVHGKLSLVNKMYGEYEDKFRQMRSALMLVMTYPGKKMLFMGTEYAQFREWDFENSLEWFMLDYPNHKKMRDYVASLNRFYLERSELWELDFSQSGFEWLLPDENEKNLVAFKRKNIKGESLIIVISFSGADQKISFNTSAEKFDCLFETEVGVFSAERIKISNNAKTNIADITVPSFSGMIISEIKTVKKRRKKENRHVL